MRKSVIIGFFVFLVIVFVVVYKWRIAQIDADQTPITEKQLYEIDNKAIASTVIHVDSQVFKSVDEMAETFKKNGTKLSDVANKTVTLDITYQDGKVNSKVKGYITNGDDNHIEMKGSTAHIVLNLN